jgi:integrase
MPKKRHQNKGLRKICGCPRRTWAKCPHSWYFNFKPRGGASYRFSLDKHFNKHIDSKSDAEDLAADLRKIIRAGKFGQPIARDEMTLRQLADTYVERYVQIERKTTKQAYVYALGMICHTVIPRPTGGSAALGTWRIGDVVTDTIERFRETRRSQGAGVAAVNRNLAALRALFNWGVRVGYIDATPFKRHSEAVVKLSPEIPRSRRLHADEETKLMAACTPHLRALVEAALETGMRRGEILSLQWSQVEGMTIEEDSTITWAPNTALVLPAGKTKTKRERRVPISSRLKAILEMRRFDPAGQPLPLSRHVFGNGIGQRVQNFKRAWNMAVLKAHGQKPSYAEKRIDDQTVVMTTNLSSESRAALDAIDLHFHDLRREAGSRWLEGGVPLHTVRDWLGHTNIAQTSTYLAGTVQTQHDAMRAFEQRRARLQKLATEVGTGGRKSQQTATQQSKKLNKDAVGSEPIIM